MKYIIMCGGKYPKFKKPKQLLKVNGEVLVERTIRLLKENRIKDIAICTNCHDFDYLGLPILMQHNEYINGNENENKKAECCWLNAYYPMEEPCCYLHGDVYYSEDAIKKILNYNPSVNTFIGNEVARNKEHLNWGEPFGWIIVNQKEFRDAINKTKQLQDEGKLERGYAISWEVYRVLNGLDPNKQYINDDTYLCIDDETIDIDAPEQIEVLDERIRARSK